MSRFAPLSPVRDVVRNSAQKIRDRQQSPTIQRGDLYEYDEEYLVYFDAPGVEEADIHIRYVDDSVRIRMERFRPPRKGFHLAITGRRMSFDGSVRLPDGSAVNPDAANATLQSDGTLEIRLPKVDSPIDVDSPTAMND